MKEIVFISIITLLSFLSSTGEQPPKVGILYLMSILTFFVLLIRSSKKRTPAGSNPWGGSTLEWQTSSLPPLENFTESPVVENDPYYFQGGK